MGLVNLKPTATVPKTKSKTPPDNETALERYTRIRDRYRVEHAKNPNDVITKNLMYSYEDLVKSLTKVND